MGIRRFDHRARFRAAYLNNTIDQINQLNKTRFFLYGQGSYGTMNVGGSITYDQVYTYGDINFYCPPVPPVDLSDIEDYFLRDRSALPTWGHTFETASSAQTFAETVATNAAAGAYDATLEFNGWGGTDLTGVTAADYLTEGGYQAIPTYTESCEGFPKDYVGSSLKAGDGASATVYPEHPSGLIGSPNYIEWGHNSASFRMTASSSGFEHLLQSFPPGSVVTSALIPIKLSNFTKQVRVETWSPQLKPVIPYYNGSAWEESWDSNHVVVDTTVTTGEVNFALMARMNTGTYTNSEGRVKRQSRWNIVGTTGSFVVTDKEWVIVDVADLCNQFLTNWKVDHVTFDFAFFPTLGPIVGDMSAKEWLASMPTKPEFEILSNPIWNDGSGELTAFQHGYPNFSTLGGGPSAGRNPQLPFQDYGPFNRRHDFERIEWGSLVQGEGILEFSYPSSLYNRVVSYSNMIRGDSPILG